MTMYDFIFCFLPNVAMSRVIAIDGPCGSGKSTIARLLSEQLGFDYLDTGALYRAVSLKLLRKGVFENSSDEDIRVIIGNTTVEFDGGKIILDGSDVSEQIRTPEIGHFSSVFSARKTIRDFLLEIQRGAATHKDIIAEGRDMTTVVFPYAWKKFFITANIEERALRRYKQLKDKNAKITIEDAINDVKGRDKRDSEREFAPLKRAHDAVVIDNSVLTPEETIQKILELLKD